MAATCLSVRRARAAHAGPPVRVLALHGLAASGTTWRAYAEHAAPAVELWTAELPWGPAGGAAWSHAGDPAEWIGRALAEVPGGVDVLVAHSFAAVLALEYLAAAGPAARPRAAVLVSPFHRRRPEDFHWDTAQHYLSVFQDVFDEALRLGSTRALPAQTRRDMALVVRDGVGPYGWLRFYESYLRSPFVDVDRVDVPVLVVAGDGDRFAPPEDAEELAAALPHGRRTLLPDCGHFPMTERAGAFAHAVHALLAELWPAAFGPSTRAS
ncbi:alpha/beta fold hydrolase [Streptomyces sp. NRRL S-87]|uniref:alpha/beta fold hydrolase n=1 Tax=Streptomyces sp. NRRL S-87 TaxID=1463920 RepID=UPI00068E9BEC|nr:alpha/beta hydrolase [Streptomyces sp. NRRL S-87]